MPAQIDWKAEDEQAWGEIVPEKQPTPRGRGPSRRIRIMILALVVASGLVAVIFWQVSRFLDSSATDVEEDVLRGHGLVVETAAKGDGDLLRELIFDRLQEWTDAQVLLAQHGLWLDRSPLGLSLADGSAAMQSEVSLEPALRQAVVTVTVPYRSSSGGADVIELQQMFYYRYEDERWLLNPPTGAFWGTRISTSGRYLTLSYPERDRQIGQRLAADLEAIIGQACHTVERMACDDNLHLAVDLVADPMAIIEMSDPAWQLAGGRSIVLPTPTLTGLPEDEAAYRALYRAYARGVVSRLLSEQTELAETGQPLIALAIADLILQQLGLQPVVKAQAPVIYEVEAMAARQEALWHSRAPLAEQLRQRDVQSTRVLVDFLATSWSEAPETEMLRLLTRSLSWQDWLRQLRPDPGSVSFADAWARYVVNAYPEVAPRIWPDQVVLLMCDPGVIGSSNLYQYDPVAYIFSKVLSGREFIRMESLPSGEGVLLTEQLINQAEQRLYLWQDGRLAPFEANRGRLGRDENTEAQGALRTRPARQNQVRAQSSDGRWLAELGDGALILSSADNTYREVVPHSGQACRGVAWVKAATESG